MDVRYTVAARALCEFAAKEGDLDLRFTPSPSAQEGFAGHGFVTGRRPPGYQAEVSLCGGHGALHVRGRADGYDPERNLLEEIKTYRGELAAMPDNHRRLHCKGFHDRLPAARGARAAAQGARPRQALLEGDRRPVRRRLRDAGQAAGDAAGRRRRDHRCHGRTSRAARPGAAALLLRRAGVHQAGRIVRRAFAVRSRESRRHGCHAQHPRHWACRR